MVFNSLTFVVFLAAVLGLYYRLGFRGQNRLLLVASYVFYGWWDWRFVSLLLFSTFFDYWCALWIEREPHPGRRRVFLSFSMFVNLGVLCVFKYFNFFAEGLAGILVVVGMQADLPTLNVVLPVGISFYTFLSMSYTIDVYRGELKATRNPLEFMLYVAYFPHLVAGPIVRASYLLPQCQRPRRIDRNEVCNGIWLILMGYVKKVVIADRLSEIVRWGFATSPVPLADANAWLVLYAFAFQIYGDFAGYSDIARGLAKLMGFELVLNFRAPYLVTNPSAFWQHWHISLSTWLRDYLYVPLGGNRHGRGRTYRNLLLTMLLGGLWHGAGVAFVLWGAYHGALLCLNRWLGEWRANRTPHPDPAKASADAATPPHSSFASGGFALFFAWRRVVRGFWILVFFHLTCVGWLLFRAGSLPKNLDQLQVVRDYAAALFSFRLNHGLNSLFWPVLLLGGLALFFQWRHEAMDRFVRWPRGRQVCAVVGALTALLALGVFEGAQFIYFQF